MSSGGTSAGARFSARTVRMKDGREATLRMVRLADAADMLEISREVVKADVGVVRSMSDLPATVEEERASLEEWITGAKSGEGGCMLVAEVGGRVVGEGTIRRWPRRRVEHIGHIGISVHPDWQELGLGRAIMNGLIEWARARRDKHGRPAVTRIDLFVFADNPRAIALYKSLGFAHEGTRRNYIRREDGRYVDDLVMGMLMTESDEGR